VDDKSVALLPTSLQAGKPGLAQFSDGPVTDRSSRADREVTSELLLHQSVHFVALVCGGSTGSTDEAGTARE
jgi:hypothetical protein